MRLNETWQALCSQISKQTLFLQSNLNLHIHNMHQFSLVPFNNLKNIGLHTTTLCFAFFSVLGHVNAISLFPCYLYGGLIKVVFLKNQLDNFLFNIWYFLVVSVPEEEEKKYFIQANL